MQTRILALRSGLIALIAVCGSGTPVAHGAEPATQAVAKSLSEQKFENYPDAPACFSGAVLSGDPDKGASLLVVKLKSGCVVPWHWHTPDEHMMFASGMGKMEMKDAKAVTLRSGAYAMMPSHHVHQFTCVSSCVIFFSSGGIFDTHYVGTDGNEIPATEALKKR